MPIKTKSASIDREEVEHCLALSDEELRQRVTRDLKAYLVWSPVRILMGRQKPGLVRRLFDEYWRLKRRAQKRVGLLLVLPLRQGGGNRICDEYDYCRRKAELLKAMDDYLKNPEIVAVAAKYSASVDWLLEVMQEMLEIIGDSAIPVSFIVLSIKEGLDDLCTCCEACGGSGLLDNGESCGACDGEGVRRPA